MASETQTCAGHHKLLLLSKTVTVILNAILGAPYVNFINIFLHVIFFSLWSDGCTNIPDISYASWEGYKFPLRNFEVFEIGAKLKYQCKPGYRASLNDPQTVTCQENLTWSSTNGCESKWPWMWKSYWFMYLLNRGACFIW